ncbi:hypothetical protein Tco_0907337 [Tanacetum coccineum]|uniref:Reverse transcriptase domain-containing protein n=1 Tax=Tanacetum coccineum TaxID=301880 RepID=A0ABQ5CLW5_9ASTR
MLRRRKLVMPLEGIHVDDKLQFVEEPVEIMEREIKRLKRSRIPLVKVRWNSRRGPEFTWEREDSFKQKYPQLFTNRASSSTTSVLMKDDDVMKAFSWIQTRVGQQKRRRSVLRFGSAQPLRKMMSNSSKKSKGDEGNDSEYGGTETLTFPRGRSLRGFKPRFPESERPLTYTENKHGPFPDMISGIRE